MIELQVEEYCKNCPFFETKTMEVGIDNQKHFIVMCEHSMKCKNLIKYLISKVKPTPESLTPCKIGDQVWCVTQSNYILQGTVIEMAYNNNMRLIITVKNVMQGEWGKQIFPTRELAEKHLLRR